MPDDPMPDFRYAGRFFSPRFFFLCPSGVRAVRPVSVRNSGKNAAMPDWCRYAGLVPLCRTESGIVETPPLKKINTVTNIPYIT